MPELIPSWLLDGGSYELCTDIPFAEAFFVDHPR